MDYSFARSSAPAQWYSEFCSTSFHPTTSIWLTIHSASIHQQQPVRDWNDFVVRIPRRFVVIASLFVFFFSLKDYRLFFSNADELCGTQYPFHILYMECVWTLFLNCEREPVSFFPEELIHNASRIYNLRQLISILSLMLHIRLRLNRRTGPESR
jgi:hypothetical protein